VLIGHDDVTREFVEDCQNSQRDGGRRQSAEEEQDLSAISDVKRKPRD